MPYQWPLGEKMKNDGEKIKKGGKNCIRNELKALKSFWVITLRKFRLRPAPRNIEISTWGGGGCNDRNAKYIPLEILVPVAPPPYRWDIFNCEGGGYGQKGGSRKFLSPHKKHSLKSRKLSKS